MCLQGFVGAEKSVTLPPFMICMYVASSPLKDQYTAIKQAVFILLKCQWDQITESNAYLYWYLAMYVINLSLFA